MPETPYPENEHDKLPQSGHSAAWTCGFAYYYLGRGNIYNVAGSELNLSKEWERGWLAAQAEDEAVDGSDKDLGS